MFRRGGFHTYRESFLRKAVRSYTVPVSIILVSALICQFFFLRSVIVLDNSMDPTIQHGDVILVARKVTSYESGDYVLYFPPYTKKHTLLSLARRTISLLPLQGISEYPLYLHRPLIRELQYSETSESLERSYYPHIVPEGFPLNIPESILGIESAGWLIATSDFWHMDSRHFGPVDTKELEGKAFFRIWPLQRFGRLTPGNTL